MRLQPDNLADHLGSLALAVGGLGVAAYGIVDNLKLIPWVDLAGFERLFPQGRAWPTAAPAGLAPLLPALEAAYGPQVMPLLQGHYRTGRARGDLPRLLRQGTRTGLYLLEPEAVVALVTQLGIAADRARALVPWLREGTMPADEAPPADLPRLESLIDARIDAALALAEGQYAAQLRLCASMVALLIALGVGAALDAPLWLRGLVGVAAVPLAPVAKDLASALQHAVAAFKRR